MTTESTTDSEQPSDGGTDKSDAGGPATGPKPIADMTAEEQVEYFKAKARKAEDLLRDKKDPDIRAMRKERDQLRRQVEEFERQSMTDLEKAVDEATKKARAETLAEVGRIHATDLIRVSAEGRVADVDALLEMVDPGKFLGDDGAVNQEAITGWLDRVAPIPDKDEQPAGAGIDLGQGARGGQPKDMALGSDPLYQSLKQTLGLD